MTSSVENESQPLLSPKSIHSVVSPPPSQSRTRLWLARKTASLRGFWRREETPILLCTFTQYFLASFAKHVVEVPFIALLERTICRQYYRSRGDGALRDAQEISGNLCKAVPVQNKLAYVVGWKFSFDALPGLLTAIFYGSFADQFGRKPVLVLFTTGMITSLICIVLVCYSDRTLPVEMVWASSIFIFIGGGQRVHKSMLFTIVADTVDQSHRTRYMYLLSSIPHLVTLIAPPFANVFMKISLWLPYEFACGLLATSYIIIWAMPESLKREATNRDVIIPPIQTTVPIIDNNESRPLPEIEALLHTHNNSQYPAHAVSSSAWTSTLREIIALFRIPTLPFVFLLYFLKPIALISKAFTYQFASETFGWEMRQTTWLRVSQAAGSTLVTVALLPLLSTRLIRRGYRAQKLDLEVIRGSLCVAVVGFGMLWQARASWMLVVALFTCGLSEGLEPALQGLATSLIDRARNARMFTTMAVVETMAKLIGGPLMARLFSVGRSEAGDGSRRINFLTSSAMFAALEVVALVASVKP